MELMETQSYIGIWDKFEVIKFEGVNKIFVTLSPAPCI